MNDYAANGYWILTKLIEGKDYLWVNKQKIDTNGTKLSFGTETGLDFGYCVKDPHTPYYILYVIHKVIDKIFFLKMIYNIILLAFISKYYNCEHVSVERASCDQSHIPIHQFLKD